MPQLNFWFFKSFVVFVAAVYWEIITIGVDYTDFEEKDCDERKKEKCMFPIIITCGGPPQREELLRKILGGDI